MANRSVVIVRSAEKEIAAPPIAPRSQIVKHISALARDPRPHGCQKLSGDDKYRIRYADYRIVYTVADAIVTVTVVRVAHRSDVYR